MIGGPALTGWMLAATMSLLAAALILRSGRQRTAINEALHELRRPLQALALFGSGETAAPVVESSTRLAAAALERLDREVNGGGEESPGREPVLLEQVLRSAVGRWRARIALDGGSLELRWRAGEAVVLGDRVALEQAIDNLIVNAIEHGGPEIVVEGVAVADRMRIEVRDSACAAPRQARRPARRAAAGGGASRDRRHGHGLALVSRAASAHRGRFTFCRGEEASVATLELPLAARSAVAGRDGR